MFKPKAAPIQYRLNNVGEKDRKALVKKICEQYPHIAGDSIKELLKGNIECCSFKGTQGNIYLCDKVPVFFNWSNNKKTQELPTLFTLWKLPNMLPRCYTVQDCPQYLFRGADLMLPGVMNTTESLLNGRQCNVICPVVKAEAAVSTQSMKANTPIENYDLVSMEINMPKVTPDDIWAIFIKGNPFPYGVGRIVPTLDNADIASGKGRFIEVDHLVGDQMMQMVNSVNYPPNITATSIAPFLTKNESDAEESESEEEAVVEEEVVTEAKEEESCPDWIFPEEAVDALIRVVTVDILKKHFPNDVCPIDFSALHGRVLKTIPVVTSQCEKEIHIAMENLGVAIGEPADAASDDDSIDLDDISSSESRSEDDDESGCTPAPAGWTVRDMGKVTFKQASFVNAKQFAKAVSGWKYITSKNVGGTMTIIKVNHSHGDFKTIKSLSYKTEADVERAKKIEAQKNAPNPIAPTRTGPLKGVIVYQTLTPFKPYMEDAGAFIGKPEGTNSLVSQSEIATALRTIMYKTWADSINKHNTENDPVLGVESDEESIDLESLDSFDLLDEIDEIADKNSTKVDKPSKPVAVAANIADMPDYIDLVTLDNNLYTVLVSKRDRTEVKAGKSMPKLSNGDIVKNFTAAAFKIVTVLAPPTASIESVLKNLDELIVIQSEARIDIRIKKTKRFTRTQVGGLQYFKIDPKYLAEKLSKHCAAAATTCEIEESKGAKKPIGVLVQGSVIPECAAFITKHFGIPANLIDQGKP